jgi:hypothetical protein
MRRVISLSLLVLSLSLPLAAATRSNAPNTYSPIERFMRAVTRIVHVLDYYDITVPKP